VRTGIVARWCTANVQGIEVECTDRKYSPDDEIVMLSQRPVVCLGEARAQLLGGVGLVELKRNHRKLESAEQPHKGLSGRDDLLYALGFEHCLESFGIDRVGSKPCSNLFDISVQVLDDRPKGCRTEDVCGTMRSE